uniref:Uncharacterized protein n=1 Tax=Ixodes ricinus TaxID=34613 RepID=A0A6B0USA7_IXORI
MSRGVVVRTHTTHAQLSSFPLSNSCALLSPLSLSTSCVHFACVRFYSHRARTRNSPPLVSSPSSVNISSGSALRAFPRRSERRIVLGARVAATRQGFPVGWAFPATLRLSSASVSRPLASAAAQIRPAKRNQSRRE